MDDEASKVDRSSLESLLDIRRDQDKFKALLAKVEERRESVDRSVYRKVRSDYEKRHKDLEAKALPLVAQLREVQAKLASRRERQRQALESVKLQKQELEFRHALGEFSASELESQLEAVRRTIDEREIDLQSTDELAADLEAGLGPPIVTVPAQKPPVQPAWENSQTEPTVDNDRTTIAPSNDASPLPPPPDPNDKTQDVPIARLVVEGSGTEHRLGRCTYIGRDTDNHIRLQASQVSRRHASVNLGPSGFVLRDEQSRYGTFVNDEPIQEQALRDGDQLRIGEVRLVFHSR
ncbi:MAG TPA: FHA domain-containing protein [Candidatus Polarisedimenticolaceae bacterium]|nr:FHA domain-containing protein [Candidatus Polarisedimenticolaceae bacterium]